MLKIVTTFLFKQMASVASAAASSEKQRRHRACRDAGPSKRHEYLAKERRKWRERDDTGKVKSSMLELNKRDESNKRKYWKEGHQKQVRKRTTGNLSTSTASENLDNTTAQRGHSRLELVNQLRKKTIIYLYIYTASFYVLSLFKRKRKELFHLFISFISCSYNFLSFVSIFGVSMHVWCAYVLSPLISCACACMSSDGD